MRWHGLAPQTGDTKLAKNSLLPEAIAGYTAQGDCPFLYSSASWFAWQTGAFLNRTGRVMPTSCSMGRGYKVNVNDMVVAFDKNMAPFRLS